MAGDGKDMTNTDGSDFVQEVTPFPLAEDLLQLSRQSLSETIVVQPDLSDADKKKENVGRIDETLGPEHPFEPFLQGSIISRTEVVEEPQGLATDGIDGNGSTLPVEHAAVSGLNSENAGTGDVSEKRVGEKIALFEGLAVVSGDDSEEFGLRKVESLDSQYDSQNDPGTMPAAELSEAPLSHNEFAENCEVDGLTDRAAQRIGENAASSGEDILFEGLTLVDLSSEAPAHGAVNLELSGVSVVERSAEVTKESVRIEGENESVTASESLNVTSKEIEVSAGPHTDVTNGTRKVETLREILSRDREERASREVGKETGEEINSGQSSSGNHVRIASDPMGSTSIGSQVNGDTIPRKVLKSAPLVNSDGNDAVNHRSSTSGTNIVGDILYNIAVGDEEGRSRQRILAFAAKRYAANVERNPDDHDALYNWALVLQESADNAGPEVGSPGKDALLDEACKKYEAATQLCPTLHEAYYNWAIAVSDRAKIRGRTKEAEDLWKQACDRYDRAVQLNWNSPQALNNWGLALQELGAIVALKEKRAIVKKAIRKFRAAIRLRFDFHRAVYNLGTVLYGLGEDIAWSGRKLSSKELSPADLNSLSAIYITAAHALKPDYPVYRGALRLVRNFLPLPYLRAGWLRIPPAGDSLAPHSDWLRLWFVLDHEALYEMEKVDRKSLAHSYSRRSSTVTSESNTVNSFAPRPSALRIEMEDILCLAPTADLSLPPGGGFCIDTVAGPQYLIADTWDSMDAWVDAIRLVYTIYAQGKRDALANVLVV